MKKTLLAMAITGLFVASAAQAATVYDADGVKLQINGDVKVNYGSDVRTFGDGVVDSNYVDLDDADFSFNLGYDIGNGIVLGASMEVSGDDDVIALSDTFMSVSGDFGTVTVGKQPLIFDDAGVSQDFKFGYDTYRDTVDSGNQVIKYKGDWDTFYGGIAYSLNGTDEGLAGGSDQGEGNGDGTAGEDNQHQVDANFGVRFANIDAAVYYSTGQNDTQGENDAYILQAMYNVDSFKLGAFYSNETSDGGSKNTETDLDHYGLSGNYYLNAWNFGLGWGNEKDNLDSDNDRNDYYAQVAYAFTSNIQSYVEVGYSDEDDSEVGYIVGMEVLF